MDIVLTKEQKAAIQGLIESDKPVRSLGGYAGTGKTTVIKTIHDILGGNWAICAFTGKAASILRRKELPGSTIHSLIYRPLTDINGQIILDAFGSPQFERVPMLECDGIIVDEASMVSKELWEDLQSFHIPIIAVGDHGQLPPIGEAINLMAKPDFILEEIHRNAGEIAWFADYIRHGFRPASYEPKEKDKIQFVYNPEEYYTKVDQIICAYNKTRVEVNRQVREMLGFKKSDKPEKGDRVICLRNDKRHGVFNGMQGKVLDITKKNLMLFEADDGNTYEIRFDPHTFNQEKPEISQNRDDPAPFDFAYCLTCHKSQGDEWGNVMVIEQVCRNWDHRKWAYTAATRAKDKLLWVAP